jgi:hypothetical protein
VDLCITHTDVTIVPQDTDEFSLVSSVKRETVFSLLAKMECLKAVLTRPAWFSCASPDLLRYAKVLNSSGDRTSLQLQALPGASYFAECNIK